MRKYASFGSNDKATWKDLGAVEASGAEQARNKVREQDPEWTHYAVTPLRNWSAATPKTKMVTTWEDIVPMQLTVEDVLEADKRVEEASVEDETAKQIQEAKDALKGAHEDDGA